MASCARLSSFISSQTCITIAIVPTTQATYSMPEWEWERRYGALRRVPGSNNATYRSVPGSEQLFDVEFLEIARPPFHVYITYMTKIIRSRLIPYPQRPSLGSAVTSHPHKAPPAPSPIATLRMQLS